jgi:hypothetical protein
LTLLPISKSLGYSPARWKAADVVHQPNAPAKVDVPGTTLLPILDGTLCAHAELRGDEVAPNAWHEQDRQRRELRRA